MAGIAERLGLGPHEFAFHFEAKGGVDADALANFLKRAATVARQHGAGLRVVGLQQGSLSVVIEAIKRGAKKEFEEKPIDTTIKTSAFIGGIVLGIIHLMSPAVSGVTPIAKAGAEMVERHQVMQITIVTNESSTVVMNKEIAKELREAEEERQLMLPPTDDIMRLSAPVAAMLRDARTGDLSGETEMVHGELHFRPDGYRYWVPVDESPVSAMGQIRPGGRFRVSGHIALNEGHPDRIVVNWAEPIPD